MVLTGSFMAAMETAQGWCLKDVSGNPFLVETCSNPNHYLGRHLGRGVLCEPGVAVRTVLPVLTRVGNKSGFCLLMASLSLSAWMPPSFSLRSMPAFLYISSRSALFCFYFWCGSHSSFFPLLGLLPAWRMWSQWTIAVHGPVAILLKLAFPW